MKEDEIVVKSADEWGGSYDEIHHLIFKAHLKNREKGIVYKSTSYTGEQIKQRVGNGVTFVAFKDDVLVATASVSLCLGTKWYEKGVIVAHYCLDAVMPEFQGQGIMKIIDLFRYNFSIASGAKIIRSGTAEKNSIQRSKFIKNGFIPCDYIATKGNDYYSVMYVKWLDPACAHSNMYCRYKYYKSFIRVRLLRKKGGNKTCFGNVLTKIGINC